MITSEEVRNRQLYAALRPGERVEVTHEVKIGSSAKWKTTTTGEVVRKDRRRHGLHYRRNIDDKVFSDILVLKRPSGELTTVTMDEFTQLKRV